MGSAEYRHKAETASSRNFRRVALISGASSGVGLALARECAAHGHAVVLIARGAERLEAAARAIRSEHAVQVQTLQLDVTSPEAADEIARFLSEHGLAVELLINNAAEWSDGTVASVAPGEAERLVRSNIGAVAEITRALLPFMGRRARILVVGSLAGELPAPGNALYSATKSFLKTWTLSLRHELRRAGISVSLLLPGAVDTSFTSSSASEEWQVARRLVASPPSAVAWCAYRGLMAGSAVIVPGLVNRTLYFGMRVLPSQLLLRARALGTLNPVVQGTGEAS